jgi:hypothetical protein
MFVHAYVSIEIFSLPVRIRELVCVSRFFRSVHVSSCQRPPGTLTGSVFAI